MTGMRDAAYWLSKIRQLKLSSKVRIMNVCGGHERSITLAGLRTVLPKSIQLIPGPGCPVCICPESDIVEAMQLAKNKELILVAFGDMLRVPVNVPKRQHGSLEQLKTAGSDIRPIASPMEAVDIARTNPKRQVVFFAAGFETTMAPVAAMLSAGVPDNLSVLLSGRLTWPAVAMLLEAETSGLEALVAPGHVATVMGANEWAFVPSRYGIACAVAGFTPVSLLAAIYSTLRQILEQRPMLDNCYPELVNEKGNQTAQRIIKEVMAIKDAKWRGIGSIDQSGFYLRKAFASYDARQRFAEYLLPLAQQAQSRPRNGGMPPACDCARVVLGKISPDQCRLYGTACIPRNPIGPCMVSDEGACRIWWSGGIRPEDNHDLAQEPAVVEPGVVESNVVESKGIP